MPTKIIRNWEDLVGLESEHYKLEIDLDNGCGWIVPKAETTEAEYFEHNHYLSTHTFYRGFYKGYTEVLRKCGFDVQLLCWDASGSLSALSASCSTSMEAYCNFRDAAAIEPVGSARYTPKHSQQIKNKRRRTRK